MSLTLKASVNKVNLCWELGSVIRKRQENNEGVHWESRHIVLTVDDHGVALCWVTWLNCPPSLSLSPVDLTRNLWVIISFSTYSPFHDRVSDHISAK